MNKPILPMDTIATDDLAKLALENAQLQTRAAQLLNACHTLENALNFAKLALNLLLFVNGGTIEVSKAHVDIFMELLKINEYNLDSEERNGNLVFMLKESKKV